MHSVELYDLYHCVTVTARHLMPSLRYAFSRVIDGAAEQPLVCAEW